MFLLEGTRDGGPMALFYSTDSKVVYERVTISLTPPPMITTYTTNFIPLLLSFRPAQQGVDGWLWHSQSSGGQVSRSRPRRGPTCRPTSGTVVDGRRRSSMVVVVVVMIVEGDGRIRVSIAVVGCCRRLSPPSSVVERGSFVLVDRGSFCCCWKEFVIPKYLLHPSHLSVFT